MNDKENNSSSKDIKVIFIPHDQQEPIKAVRTDPSFDIKIEPVILPPTPPPPLPLPELVTRDDGIDPQKKKS